MADANAIFDALLNRLELLEAEPDSLALRDELRDRLLDDPNLRARYILHSHLVSNLQWMLDPLVPGERVIEVHAAIAAPAAVRAITFGSLFTRLPGGTFAVGALVLVAVAAAFWGLSAQFFRKLTTRDAEVAVATIHESSNVKWSSEPPSGDLQSGQSLAIDAGVLELQLKQGTTLLVQGPARWSIDAANSATLTSGTLIAQVPRQAIGFALETPAARIVDLGTEFGVQVDDAGVAQVSVMTGIVDVLPTTASSQSRRLIAGESVRVSPGSGEIEKAEAFAAPALLLKAQERRQQSEASRHIAYVVPTGTIGNQAEPRNLFLGLDFDVNRPIDLHRLGVFDSGGDGILGPTVHTVSLWSRDINGTPHDPRDDHFGAKLLEMQFTAASPGELVGGSRFKPLERTLRLEPGHYTLVADGFNRENPNGNNVYAALKPANKAWTIDHARGALNFRAWGRWGESATVLPDHLDYSESKPPHQYASGTFEYSLPTLAPTSRR